MVIKQLFASTCQSYPLVLVPPALQAIAPLPCSSGGTLMELEGAVEGSLKKIIPIFPQGLGIYIWVSLRTGGGGRAAGNINILKYVLYIG
jgi:hypothetical protein